jgi:hypothetical protein
MKKCYKDSSRRGIAYKRRKDGYWIVHILRSNCFIKYFIEGKVELKIEIRRRRGRRLSSYWITLRRAEDVESEGGRTRSLLLRIHL